MTTNDNVGPVPPARREPMRHKQDRARGVRGEARSSPSRSESNAQQGRTVERASSELPPAVPPAVSLRPPRQRVERRAIWWWTIRVALTALVGLAAPATVYATVSAARPWLEPALILLTIAFAITGAVMPTWRYHVHRWETTDTAVYSLTGWVVREWRIVPISRIQSVDVVRGPLQQLLNLATVKVVTASREGEIKIEGMDVIRADEVANALTVLTQRTPGDAT